MFSSLNFVLFCLFFRWNAVSIGQMSQRCTETLRSRCWRRKLWRSTQCEHLPWSGYETLPLRARNFNMLFLAFFFLIDCESRDKRGNSGEKNEKQDWKWCKRDSNLPPAWASRPVVSEHIGLTVKKIVVWCCYFCMPPFIFPNPTNFRSFRVDLILNPRFSFSSDPAHLLYRWRDIYKHALNLPPLGSLLGC